MWERGLEGLGVVVETHLFYRGEAVRHYEAGGFGGGRSGGGRGGGSRGGGGVEPAAESDAVVGLEGDVFARHFGWWGGDDCCYGVSLFWIFGFWGFCV